jgi:hypothetical protein
MIPRAPPEVSKQLPESRNSGAYGNFGAQSRRWDEAGMGTKSHLFRQEWAERVGLGFELVHIGPQNAKSIEAEKVA